jgi:carboxyl-terminal processing protease
VYKKLKFSFFLAASLSAFAYSGALYSQDAPKLVEKDKNTQTLESLELFGNIFEETQNKYVEEVDSKVLIKYAINGMLTSLDPHSGYLPPESYKSMQIQTRGEFGGLGIEVTLENGFIKVVSPIDDTPAARAKIRSGDYITHLDGISILGMTLSEAVDRMRGKVNTKIVITIVRSGLDEPFDVEILRDVINIRSVRSEIIYDIGYVRITTFHDKTFKNLTKAFHNFEKNQGIRNLKGFVIDLRNNPGGLLSQAIAVSDAFIEHGEIVSTIGRYVSDTERFNARSGDLANGKPITVLVNLGSASASEIVAGALQDHQRAIIVGKKTFGKGSVQTIMPLGKEHGAIRLTTARYYTPSGRSIQALGIEPDIIVEQFASIKQKKEKPSKLPRSENSLKGRLDNKQFGGKEMGTDPKEVEKKAQDRTRMQEIRDTDPQLGYAIDLLRGIASYSKSS